MRHPLLKGSITLLLPDVRISSCLIKWPCLQVYDSTKQLRYGHLMIMTDQDHDGSHIKGLIMNFLHHFYPSLLQVNGFLLEFITPIVKVRTLPLLSCASFYSHICLAASGSCIMYCLLLGAVMRLSKVRWLLLKACRLLPSCYTCLVALFQVYHRP